jgi:hypothetical protein
MARSGGWIGFCLWIVYFLALTGLAVYGVIGFIEVKGDPESWPPLLIVALGLLVGVPLWFLWLLRRWGVIGGGEGMALSPDDLFPGEEVILTRLANLLIRPEEHGLSELFVDAGLGGEEAIGGRLYLTNYRLLFRAHQINRLRGAVSLFLPSIAGVENTSMLFKRSLRIDTKCAAYEFIVWGQQALVDQIEERRSRFSNEKRKKLRRLLMDYPECLGRGLRPDLLAETVNQFLRGLSPSAQLLEDLTEGRGSRWLRWPLCSPRSWKSWTTTIGSSSSARTAA